jgi:hypothetical protein
MSGRTSREDISVMPRHVMLNPADAALMTCSNSPRHLNLSAYFNGKSGLEFGVLRVG